MHPRVKICGITSPEDALAAVDAGADALGFVFHPASPRHVSVEVVRAITAQLPPLVSRVGVFVDADAKTLISAVRDAGIDTLQLHGRETPALCRSLAPLPVIKAFRVSGPETLGELEPYRGMAWLLDSYVAGALGGTGQAFNWDLARDAVHLGAPVVLAGGLTPENVAAAVTAVRPYAVDVSSGVERAPGRKDPARMRAFVRAARSA